MRGRLVKFFRAAAVSGTIALLFATVGVAAATSASARGCAQFEALKRVFPTATAIGLRTRTAVRRGAVRAPWPGTCAVWRTSYSRRGTGLDVSLTLYGTHKQALVALAEPAYGPVERLANGALVRTYESVTSMKKQSEVVSVYRNVFISSGSIADRPISLATQLRLHRRVQAGVHTLER